MLPKLGTQKNGRGDKIAIEAFEINDFGEALGTVLTICTY